MARKTQISLKMTAIDKTSIVYTYLSSSDPAVLKSAPAPITELNYSSICAFIKLSEKIANYCVNYMTELEKANAFNPIYLITLGTVGEQFENASDAATETLDNFKVLNSPDEFYNQQFCENCDSLRGDFKSLSALGLEFYENNSSDLRSLTYTIYNAFYCLVLYKAPNIDPNTVEGQIFYYINQTYTILNGLNLVLPGEAIPNPYPFPPVNHVGPTSTITSLTTSTFLDFAQTAVYIGNLYAYNTQYIFSDVPDKRFPNSAIIAAQNTFKTAGISATNVSTAIAQAGSQDIRTTLTNNPAVLTAAGDFQTALNLDDYFFTDSIQGKKILTAITKAFNSAYIFDETNFVANANTLYQNLG